MDTQPAQRTAAAALEEGVISTIRQHGGIARNAIVTHFDLVASLRSLDASGHERVWREHWAPTGSDPHVSYGYLSAQAAQIRNELV
jgi:hypothetical protein